MKTFTEINNSRSTRENFLENLSKKECYTLGATALDCSIMLTFQRISDDTDTNRYVQQRSMLLPVDIFCMIHVIMDLKKNCVQLCYLKAGRCSFCVLILFFLFVLFKRLLVIVVCFFLLISSIKDDVRKHIVSIGHDKFLVNATVIDVDPKAAEQHFVKYVKQTNISHKAYLDNKF